tara:strand:+ start:2128 stop:2382 length:255 start_codon:yes stop_codon:yes gene_type:complete
MKFNSLIKTLYDKYYLNDSRSVKFSQETSSHWREFGKKTNVVRVKKIDEDDGPCLWYVKYPSNKPPFWKNFDGVHLHRLIKVTK